MDHNIPMSFPTQPIREAVEALPETTLYQIADRLEWFKNGKPDVQRLSRRLGQYGRSQQMHYDTAVKIIRAAHIDPVDVGL